MGRQRLVQTLADDLLSEYSMALLTSVLIGWGVRLLPLFNHRRDCYPCTITLRTSEDTVVTFGLLSLLHGTSWLSWPRRLEYADIGAVFAVVGIHKNVLLTMREGSTICHSFRSG